jgi:ABC-2 type transport system ATP-binding protein
VKNSPSISVDVSGLTVRFAEFIAVNNISFSVNKGEIFGFLGANGAGKTTTIRVLCGLIVPTAGRVQISDISSEEGSEAMKSKVGYMSQKFTLYNDLTIDENFAFTASLRKLSKATLKQRTNELLEFIEFSKPRNTLVRDLPGGIKQQVSLAASILHDPEIIFLDEPTAGVTPAARARFWALIRKLSGNGKTVFVTTHYMDEAEQCGRIASNEIW